MYFMIGVWGGENRQYASLKFFLYTMFGSALMLVAFLALFFKTGAESFAIPYLIENGGAIAKNAIRTKKYAMGGIATLQTYAAGGKLLNGDGDGMSDSIPAVINGPKPQRAALADGEFVVPADVVSHLGNGSTEAGAKKLHEMMNSVRQARTGNPKQGKKINPNKFMPKK
jgi:hypothetical protein